MYIATVAPICLDVMPRQLAAVPGPQMLILEKNQSNLIIKYQMVLIPACINNCSCHFANLNDFSQGLTLSSVVCDGHQGLLENCEQHIW